MITRWPTPAWHAARASRSVCSTRSACPGVTAISTSSGRSQLSCGDSILASTTTSPCPSSGRSLAGRVVPASTSTLPVRRSRWYSVAWPTLPVDPSTSTFFLRSGGVSTIARVGGGGCGGCGGGGCGGGGCGGGCCGGGGDGGCGGGRSSVGSSDGGGSKVGSSDGNGSSVGSSDGGGSSVGSSDGGGSSVGSSGCCCCCCCCCC